MKIIGKSLNFKNFLLTSIVLFTTIMLIYFILYAFIPPFYAEYKRNFLEEESKKIIDQIARNESNYEEGFSALRKLKKKKIFL